ncbi:MAG: hypothetical protein WCJ14_05975 [Verrucomicrobiota bacterium]
MPLPSMVWFMIKWAIAAIPAFAILFLIGFFLTLVFGFLGAGFLHRFR